ncbi:hypothetical protein FGG08_004900 [Glutinoglossum americanum]|uniref:Mtf2-like C-terminal domain-containing protein n=1 Tax=Glutinoglossum americanum TaxID=1670608 RepID=A0A9P8KZ27_9PEZI|nr:hypothetical protein FGG08_004900 [Glutinoglossum americanum]
MRLFSRSQLQSVPLLPFLYETRSLCRRPVSTTIFGSLFGCRKQPTNSRGLQRLREVRYQEPGGFSDGFDRDEFGGAGSDGGGFDRETLANSKQHSTITDFERAAFNRIFREIMENTNHSDERSQWALDAVNENWSLKGKRIQSASTKPQHYNDLNEIITSAVAVAGPEMETEQDREVHRRKIEALSRYPTALRAAAARASGLLKLGQEGQRRMGQIPDDDEVDEMVDEVQSKEFEQLQKDREAIETYRLAELARIENKLRAAETDIELWTVLEDEVFSMAKRVGREARKVKKSLKRLRNDVPELPQDPEQNIPILAIAGQNYPYALLLAMRLLRHDFHSPSMCLTLFQYVKNLGLSSYVLGASTALYNEVLDIKRKEYHDLTGIVELLIEMQKNGVEFNDGTEVVLAAILRESKQVITGMRGEGLKAIWQTRPMRRALVDIGRVRALISRKRDNAHHLNLA